MANLKLKSSDYVLMEKQVARLKAALDRHREVETRLLRAWDSWDWAVERPVMSPHVFSAIAKMRKLTEEKKNVPTCPQCGESATYQIPDGQWFDSNAHAWRTK